TLAAVLRRKHQARFVARGAASDVQKHPVFCGSDVHVAIAPHLDIPQLAFLIAEFPLLDRSVVPIDVHELIAGCILDLVSPGPDARTLGTGDPYWDRKCNHA